MENIMVVTQKAKCRIIVCVCVYVHTHMCMHAFSVTQSNSLWPWGL